MKKEPSSIKITLIKYGIAVFCGAVIMTLLLIYLDPAKAETTAELYKILCDSFSLPGIFLIFAGILAWIAGQGGFTGLGYLGRYLRRTLLPGGRTKYPHETFYDYIQEQKEKHKSSVGFGFLIITGAFFLAVGIVFLVLFYSVPQA